MFRRYYRLALACLPLLACGAGDESTENDLGSETDALGGESDGDDPDGRESDGGDTELLPELRFSPLDCEEEWSTSVLVMFGLDDGDLRVERLVVTRETGAFTTPEEAVASLSFGGPVSALEKVHNVGPLELWEAPAIDFGAIAWIDTILSEVAFSGSVIWSGGYDADPVEDSSVLIGGPPAVAPAIQFAPNRFWQDEGTQDRIAEFGVRTEVVARYAACGETSVVVYVYTPVVGGVDPRAARGLVLVSGYRSSGAPSIP